MPVNTSGILRSISGGLQTNRIVSQLVRARQQPIQQMQQEKQQISKEIDHVESVKKKLGSLGSKLDKLDQGSNLRALSASSSDEEVATVTSDSDASASNYSLNVETLAKVEKNMSNGFSDSSSQVAKGELDITVDEGSSSSKSFTIEIEDDASLASVKNKINESDASEHVSATIIDSGRESHLKIERNKAGHAMDTTASNALTLNHSISEDASGRALSFTEHQAGKNTVFTLDGQEIERRTNQVSDVVDGVTFNLKSTGSADIDIAVDNEKVMKRIEGFVDAFNKTVEKLKSDSDMSSSAKRQAMSQLRGIISSGVSGLDGPYSNLASIGIETSYQTGKLQMNNSEVKEALTNSPDSVKTLFAGDQEGVANRMNEAIDSMTDNSGFFESKISGLESRKERINDDISDKEQQVEQYRQRLQDRFTNLKQMRTKMQNNFSDLM